MNTNRRVILSERPRYIVPTANCFRMDTAPMPEAGEGQVLLRTLWLATDSMLYSRVKRVNAVQSEPIQLKDAMVGSAVGRVEQSHHPRFKVGDLVSGLWAWQDYVVVKGERLRNLDFGPQKPSYALGAFGVSGFGAYIALDTLAPPAAGETVVVGTVLGSLGHIAAQIAKLKGCRVVGMAGTAEKCKVAMQQLGIDACVNRDEDFGKFSAALKAACPNGIDVYVETVGGKGTEAVIPVMNRNGRIAAVGQSATSHFGEPPFKGPLQNTMNFIAEVIYRRLTIRGLVTSDHVAGRVKAFDAQMKAWIAAGSIKPMEDIVVGLEKAPDAFQGVFEGRNRGTQLVKVAD